MHALSPLCDQPWEAAAHSAQGAKAASTGVWLPDQGSLWSCGLRAGLTVGVTGGGQCRPVRGFNTWNELEGMTRVVPRF